MIIRCRVQVLGDNCIPITLGDVMYDSNKPSDYLDLNGTWIVTGPVQPLDEGLKALLAILPSGNPVEKGGRP